MTPIHTPNDCGNSCVAHAIRGSKIDLFLASFLTGANFKNLPRFQPRGASFFPSWTGKKSSVNSMSKIFCASHPLKVVWNVVCFVAVFVIYLRAVARVGDKSKRDKPMNLFRQSFVFDRQTNAQVPLFVGARLKNAAFVPNKTETTRQISTKGFYSPKVRRLIALVTRYRQPKFSHDFPYQAECI